MMTKKQLGMIMIVIGLVATVLILAVDWFGAGNFQGLGSVQKLALGSSLATAFIGLTLLPLGDRPA